MQIFIDDIAVNIFFYFQIEAQYDAKVYKNINNSYPWRIAPLTTNTVHVSNLTLSVIGWASHSLVIDVHKIKCVNKSFVWGVPENRK